MLTDNANDEEIINKSFMISNPISNSIPAHEHLEDSNKTNSSSQLTHLLSHQNHHHYPHPHNNQHHHFTANNHHSQQIQPF